MNKTLQLKINPKRWYPRAPFFSLSWSSIPVSPCSSGPSLYQKVAWPLTLKPLVTTERGKTAYCYISIRCQGLYDPLSVFTYWKDVGVVTGGAYGTYNGCKPYSFSPDCGSPCSVEVYKKAKTPECSRNCSRLNGKSYEEDKFKGKSAYWMRAPYDYSRNETNPLFRQYLDKFNVSSPIYSTQNI